MVEERIAILETKVSELQESNQRLETKTDSIDTKVDNLNLQLSKQKGFIGGVMFVFSSLVTIITMAVSYFFHRTS